MSEYQELTPSRSESPLFEPELPTTSPLEDEVPSYTTSSTDEMNEQEETLPFVQKLQAIDAAARDVIASWDPVYLGGSKDSKLSSGAAGTKRKASEVDSDSNNHDSGSDSDDEEERVPPHDPNKQDRPKLPIYHPGFKLTENVTQDILRVFISYITAAMQDGYSDKEAEHLRNEVVRSKTIKYQTAMKLAVAGDTGAGKSALLNSILGVINLNIESDAGGACTCVITEFRQAPPRQETPYAAEIEFFDIKVCLKLVTDLFMQWYGVKHKQKQDPEEVDDNDLNQMKTARDCMQQMFANRLGQQSIEAFLSTATSATDYKVLGQLERWTTDIHRMFIADGETSIAFGSSTPEELIEQYHVFTREVSHASFRGEPLNFTPWPLVKIVHVSLQSPILSQNVSVADVPGVSDTNYFRVENANRYLQSCDMTIVVGKIDRLQDNATFAKQYMDAFRRRRSGSVILVATRSDDLNEDAKSTINIDVATQEQLAQVAQKILDIGTKIAMLANNMDRNRIEKKIKANKQLKKQKKRLTSQKNALEKQRKDILIESRNKQVSSVISGNYRTDTGDDAGAAVYCVSNRMYMRHLRGFDKSDALTVPTMTIEQTRIPAVCSHLYLLPSKGMTASLDHFVRVTVPTLLDIIQMSCSTTTVARANHLVAIVRDAREAMVARLTELTKKFNDTDIKLLYTALSDHALQRKFDANVKKCLIKWEKLPAATHRAAVNKQGNYVQKKKDIKLHWNEDMLEAAKGGIDIAFQAIIDGAVETFKADAAQASKDVIRDLDYILKNDLKALAGNAYSSCFKDTLPRFYEEVNVSVEKAAKNLKEALTLVHLKAIRVRQGDYFPMAIEDIYKTALKKRAVKGMTMYDIRAQHLKETIPGPNGPFTKVPGMVRDDAKKAISKVSAELRTELDQMLQSVENAFERMKRKKESDTPEGRKFRTELHQLVEEAKRILNGVAQESLDLCKQYK